MNYNINKLNIGDVVTFSDKDADKFNLKKQHKYLVIEKETSVCFMDFGKIDSLNNKKRKNKKKRYY